MKVLFSPITSSSIAHTVRSLAVADELKKKGHQIFFTSCSKRKDFIEKNGYQVYKTYTPVNMNDPDDQSINYLRDNQDKFIEWFQTEIQAAKEINPDIVVQAPALFGTHIFHATNIPTISIIDTQYLDESKGILGLSKSTNKLSDRILVKLLKPIFNKKFYELYVKEISEIYKKIGIKGDFNSKSLLYGDSPVIIPSDEVTQPLNRTRRNYHYVGPIFWQGFENMDSDITEAFLNKFKANNKLIYLSFGGSVFNKNIYDEILKKVLKSKWKFIVSLGPNFNRDEFPEDNNSYIIRNFVPGLLVSKHADIIINTGSQGTVMQGLTYGKPQIAFPTMIDQAFYANRLEELGLGINANKVSLLKFSKRESYNVIPEHVPEKVYNGIRRILNNPNYEKNANKFVDILKGYPNPAQRVANIIADYYNQNG